MINNNFLGQGISFQAIPLLPTTTIPIPPVSTGTGTATAVGAITTGALPAEAVQVVLDDLEKKKQAEYARQAAAAAGAGRAAAAAHQAAQARGETQEKAQAAAEQAAAKEAARYIAVQVPAPGMPRGLVIAAVVGGGILLYLALRPSPASSYQRRKT